MTLQVNGITKYFGDEDTVVSIEQQRIDGEDYLEISVKSFDSSPDGSVFILKDHLEAFEDLISKVRKLTEEE